VLATKSGIRGRPTLVNNVETLAHMALIARFGSEWFRSVGDADDPGTMLVTYSGALHKHGVVEVPTGTLLAGLLEHAGGTDPGTIRAILIGGYHGSWLPATAFVGARLSRSGLKSLGATPGAGIVHALGMAECGLAETAQISAYLADQSARQCGPCLNGLPRIAELLHELAHGRTTDQLVKEIRRVTALVDGRGSCRHPDGTARMIRSALSTFAAEIELHQHRRCVATDATVSGR
jgi:NADH:ubiquinone oxidoreductase subunit F (NADH-binding)